MVQLVLSHVFPARLKIWIWRSLRSRVSSRNQPWGEWRSQLKPCWAFCLAPDTRRTLTSRPTSKRSRRKRTRWASLETFRERIILVKWSNCLIVAVCPCYVSNRRMRWLTGVRTWRPCLAWRAGRSCLMHPATKETFTFVISLTFEYTILTSVFLY